MNQKFGSWFSEGKFVEAITGSDGYFILEKAYLEHDRIFVLRELDHWVDSASKAEEASDGFTAAVTKHLSDNDAQAMYDLVWALVVLNPKNFFLIRSRIEALLDEADALEQPGLGWKNFPVVRQNVRRALESYDGQEFHWPTSDDREIGKYLTPPVRRFSVAWWRSFIPQRHA